MITEETGETGRDGCWCGKLGMAAISWCTGVSGTLCEGVGLKGCCPMLQTAPKACLSDSPQNMPTEEQDTDIIPTAAQSLTPGQYTASLDFAIIRNRLPLNNAKTHSRPLQTQACLLPSCFLFLSCVLVLGNQDGLKTLAGSQAAPWSIP